MTTFYTKEEYLAYRAEFKENYRKLSGDIRALKFKIVNGFRAGEYMGNEQNLLRGLRLNASAQLESLAEVREQARAISRKNREPLVANG